MSMSKLVLLGGACHSGWWLWLASVYLELLGVH